MRLLHAGGLSLPVFCQVDRYEFDLCIVYLQRNRTAPVTPSCLGRVRHRECREHAALPIRFPAPARVPGLRHAPELRQPTCEIGQALGRGCFLDQQHLQAGAPVADKLRQLLQVVVLTFGPRSPPPVLPPRLRAPCDPKAVNVDGRAPHAGVGWHLWVEVRAGAKEAVGRLRFPCPQLLHFAQLLRLFAQSSKILAPRIPMVRVG
mmetsp:Transcript_18296/g.44911  ORF Transcript_18296/g.44911 Transcript_18296/m.44911 type:complete len:205 (-) Transcript_18296:173-787(-)|eukprot:CAMPEP_0206245330 /NCGR_PEP_ID=MMETSP0047_2-20121206/18638_1 /ASSEMBLY_ACC=CAM_ASM_000192 /TAXON_ID=195065 /ORGANISM="Chroomonas mesostigmatica_cf, Strain CCMP1168" /LENGTH=204 /DNA_ID=CAMNT_0053670619 /DNA_START=166 /DNA_END=780 /DNA_ORIENTATION=+